MISHHQQHNRLSSVLRHIRAAVEWVGPSVMLFLLFLVLSALCRVAYLLENGEAFATIFSDNTKWTVTKGCLTFDVSAFMYTNAVIILMMLLMPYLGNAYRKTTLWLLTVINSICIVLNLGDAVYYRYTGHRTTMSVFGEFQNETNLGKVFGTEIVSHWYLVIYGVLLILLTYYAGRAIIRSVPRTAFSLRTAVCSAAMLLLFVPLCIAGIRGGFTTAVRPITISNASQYVRHPAQAPFVLNTPFSLLRTIGKNVFQDPGYYTDSQLAAIYTPVKQPPAVAQAPGKNIVVLIVESFGREYIGAYNQELDGGKYKGYTPFIDSLYKDCLSFDYSFANGRQSIDGMPSILSGIPRFIEPFFVTPASVNKVSGLAGELQQMGYSSAFFHGAENGSMGFEAFARATGFDAYYGRNEFNKDKRFDGDKDFDGTWAIWDEPFLQFYALKMSEMKQPFVTAVFTASSHHPFVVPEKYADRFKDDGLNPIHKCIQYTDMALKRFFDTARQQPWFKNTIFVITSDHTNISDHKEYGTDLGVYCAPLLIYDPSGQMPCGRRHCIAQQTDIMPTLLNYVGCKRPYVAWGIDLLNTRDEDTWAVNHTSGGVYQYIKGDYLLQFDGQKVTSVYNIKKDWLLTTPVSLPANETADMERQLKAIIQTYMQRMVNNKLVE